LSLDVAYSDEYWMLVMDIARRNSLKRIVRCSQIMGRTESDDLTAAQIFYPCMQCADIFFLKVCIQPQLCLFECEVSRLHGSHPPADRLASNMPDWLPMPVFSHMLLALVTGRRPCSAVCSCARSGQT
jgi:hypothetical protein